jgi:hypothetical protein
MSKKKLVYAVGLVGVGSSVFVLASCLSDPRESEAVSVISACDMGALSADPANPQSSMRAYLDASKQLLAVATEVEKELTAACNALDTELGLATGQDVTSACQAIGARASSVNKGSPLPPPGAPMWAELRADAICQPTPRAYDDCVSSCVSGCDVSKCEGPVAGACEGTCKGTCVTTADDAPCTGRCVGSFAINGPPATCDGQCTGVCTAAAWSGQCEGACGGFFIGKCGGTCTGQCNGAPINVAPATDGGTDAAASDAGDGGAPEGGPPPGAGGPPNNADGNCKGVCAGVCSSQADGSCQGAPCLAFKAGGPPDLAPFKGGNCSAGAGLCAGLCESAGGTGTTTSCRGTCASATPQCKGLCVGACEGKTANGACTGTLKCGQSRECEVACKAKSELALKCAPSKTVEAYGVTDPALAAAFKKHGAQLGAATARVNALRTAYGYIGKRAYGDFVAIGLSGDLVRACAAEGTKINDEANEKIRKILAADPRLKN